LQLGHIIFPDGAHQRRARRGDDHHARDLTDLQRRVNAHLRAGREGDFILHEREEAGRSDAQPVRPWLHGLELIRSVVARHHGLLPPRGLADQYDRRAGDDRLLLVVDGPRERCRLSVRDGFK
jgi:hypothetical protein